MELTRESLRSGRVRQQIIESGVDIGLLDEAELTESRRTTLAAATPGEDVWLFAYGSLMWNPTFHFTERHIGRVHGYHRRFCLWTHLGRGSPATPGLMLGLEPGGSCRGIAFRIAGAAVEEETDIVWAREMISAAYVPRWVRVHTSDGPVAAIAFTMNRDFSRYAGRLPEPQVAATIARARGSIGPCADYLFDTLAHLETLGIRDHALASLREQVVAMNEPSERP
jgi:cation transport protein ChaC